VVQLELAASSPIVVCQTENLTRVRTLDPTGRTTGGKKGIFRICISYVWGLLFWVFFNVS